MTTTTTTTPFPSLSDAFDDLARLWEHDDALPMLGDTSPLPDGVCASGTRTVPIEDGPRIEVALNSDGGWEVFPGERARDAARRLAVLCVRYGFEPVLAAMKEAEDMGRAHRSEAEARARAAHEAAKAVVEAKS